MSVGNTRSNTPAIRRAEVYSTLILDEIKDGFLPEGLHRDVTDFGDGDTLFIPTFGEVVLRELEEGQDTPIDSIDTGRISLTITKHEGAGAALTDEMQEDSYLASEFDAMIVPKMLRAIKESYETDLLSQQSKQTAADVNAINSYAHRFCASGGSGARTMTIDDIIYLKLAFDKANLPDEGRILIVDPIVEATINSLTNIVNVSDNPRFEGMVETGFAKNMKFIKNIFGFDIWCSNRLPRLTAQETLDTTGTGLVQAPSGNDDAEIGDIVNQAWCVADDTTCPIMGAWRRMPTVAGERQESKRRDVFYATARWGFGLQRPQSIASIATSSTQY
tara:strand:- start:10517 stop:11515 length:999 start_codon:yes stop_codon:yes gene_type:complete